MEQILLISVVTLGLVFAFINGFHDGGNVIATIVSSRSMSPRKALLIASMAEFLGPLSLGTAVAVTVGKDIIDPSCFVSGNNLIPGLLLISALVSAIVWDLLTWWVGMPSSSSHALVGGLVGAGIAAFGSDIVSWDNLFFKVILVLLVSPIIGMAAGYLVMKLSIFVFHNAHPRIGNLFKRMQLFSMVFLGASHGTNDAQKSMGVITLMLFMSGGLSTFSVPGWVVLGCALSLALGVSFGGWRIIKTVGTKIFKVEPIHSFNAQLAAGSVIFAAGFLGGPVSTTQIVGSTIVGVGAGHRATDVRWIVVKDMIIAWLVTIPASTVLAGAIYLMASMALGQGMGGFENFMELLGQ
ncbi:MAG: inorganic phosphate transporter [Deltaproteobacteria bacterium]|nr:MAG: inorganic phosphate transporter [Deltaproteobacteria bacterium]